MGFSPDWLALREPHDLKARDPHLATLAAKSATDNPVVLDLGCGTGSTIRALKPYLPENTKWRLVDNDPVLLSLAKNEAGFDTEAFLLDLGDIESLPLEGATLVTGSALLDLVSRKWLEDLAALLEVPTYFALSYDGQMSWQPESELDAEITSSFNSHQRSDKGFGPALGPDAASTASEIFSALGFEVSLARSPWQLASEDKALHDELIAGIAEAAMQAGAPMAKSWALAKLSEGFSNCVIGHADIVALPGSTLLGSSDAQY